MKIVITAAMITKKYLLDIAKNFDCYEDFIYWVQAELGVFDESNKSIEQRRENDILCKYQQGEDILLFLHNLVPRGWFYVAENIWRESHNFVVKEME